MSKYNPDCLLCNTNIEITRADCTVDTEHNNYKNYYSNAHNVKHNTECESK